MPGAFRRMARPAGAALVLLLLARACWPTGIQAEGILQAIRDDVRGASSDSSAPGSRDEDDDDDGRRHGSYHGGYDDDDDDGFSGFLVFQSARLAFYTLASPFWGPYAALEDDLSTYDYFPRFPYDRVPGYMMSDPCGCWPEDPSCGVDPMRSERWPAKPRTWAARLRMEYADEFNDLQRVSGHLLLSTRSRLGLDTETSYLEEKLFDGTQDELWLGDCNVVYRFAQGEHAQFRTGVGFNWLDDPEETDFGFNFTYGADLFPRRPWVLSATLDWGTLGEAELFRFRTTGGVVVHGVELYTGYEYLDIDSSQMNGIMGGVRIWF